MKPVSPTNWRLKVKSPIIFIGGALTGVAALVTAALTSNSNKSELKYTICDKNEVKNMPASMLVGYLNAYTTEVVKIYNDLMLNNILNLQTDCFEELFHNLSFGKEEGYFSNLKDKTLRSLEKHLRVYMLKSYRNSAASNFKKFRPAFVRGNEILRENGMVGYSIDSSVLSERFNIDYDLPVPEWAERFQQMHSRIEKFLLKSSDVSIDMGRNLLSIESQAEPTSSSK